MMILLLVATLMSSSTVAMIARQRAINRENAIAVEGARSMIERMRGQPFAEVFQRYNDDPTDDPAGPGSAPGARFEVFGLRPQVDDPDGFVGEILFPTVDVSGGGPPDLELREDVPNATFGTPRDLSGDSIIDANDHTDDYFLLPVQIRIRWTGKVGDREFRTFATLCEFNWE